MTAPGWSDNVELIVTEEDDMPEHDIAGVTRDCKHWELAIYADDEKGTVVTPARLYDIIAILEAQAKLLGGEGRK